MGDQLNITGGCTHCLTAVCPGPSIFHCSIRWPLQMVDLRVYNSQLQDYHQLHLANDMINTVGDCSACVLNSLNIHRRKSVVSSRPLVQFNSLQQACLRCLQEWTLLQIRSSFGWSTLWKGTRAPQFSLVVWKYGRLAFVGSESYRTLSSGIFWLKMNPGCSWNSYSRLSCIWDWKSWKAPRAIHIKVTRRKTLKRLACSEPHFIARHQSDLNRYDKVLHFEYNFQVHCFTKTTQFHFTWYNQPASTMNVKSGPSTSWRQISRICTPVELQLVSLTTASQLARQPENFYYGGLVSMPRLRYCLKGGAFRPAQNLVLDRALAQMKGAS